MLTQSIVIPDVIRDNTPLLLGIPDHVRADAILGLAA